MADEMVSLKETPSEEAQEAKEYKPSEYPVSFYLDDDDIAALKIASGTKAGDEFTMTAKVRVGNASTNSSIQNGSSASVCIEIMEANMTPVSTGKSTAELIYDKGM